MDERERQLRALVDGGLSTRAIAGELGVHQVTARRWLAGYGLRTIRSEQIAATRAGQAANRDVVLRPCRQHGVVEHRVDKLGQYRCRSCRVESVSRRRARKRALLVTEAGGACLICGYARYAGALQFHHLDPSLKEFSVSAGLARSLATLRAEAAKCVLLCANCHAEIEAGVARLPLPSGAAPSQRSADCESEGLDIPG